MRLAPVHIPARALQPSLGRPRLSQLGVVVGASAATGLALAATDSWVVPFALIIMGAFAALGFTRPAIFVGLVLFVRPLLDDFSDQHTLAGVKSANLNGGIALLVVTLLVVGVASSRRIYLPRSTLPFALVLAITAVGAPYAMASLGGEVGTQPVGEVARLAALLAMYVLAANLFATTERAQRLFALVGLSAVIPAINGIVQWVTTGGRAEFGLDVLRITGTFIGPNPFGAYLALGALILITLPTGLPRLVRWPAIAIILTALVGTYSREGWIIFLLGLVLMEWRRRLGLMVFVCLAVVVMVFTIPTVHDRVLKSETRTHQKEAFTSFDWRVGNWTGLLEKWSDSPAFGFGTQSTEFVNPKKNEFQLNGLRAAREDVGGYAAHNLGVKALVEGGLILTLGYLLLFASLVGRSFCLAREHWELSRHGYVLFIIWLVTVVIGVTSDDPTTNTPMMFALLALFGCLEGVWRATGSKAQDAPGR